MRHTSHRNKPVSALGQALDRHERLFVLTGAGVSTGSGLGDYRDRNGHWKRRQPMSGQEFKASETARQRYWSRSYIGWPVFSGATPSPAHHALAALERRGRIACCVTQNIDGLHQAAGHRDIVELHGALHKVICLSCGNRSLRDTFQERLQAANPWLDTLTATLAPDGDADLETNSLPGLQLPACEHCGGVLKPDVVFFGENVPKPVVEEAMNALRAADGLLVVGSSLMVYSGFRFAREAARLGLPIIIVTDGVTRADDLATLRVSGDCGEALTTALR
ncbi:MAG: NAD-dependent deacetylase [Gammaproteobacteria bacterium]|nr:MAG: NAD-dependent deacetylase [Gammaproteobacteria bacterium]PIE36822.1 MAG: NAD-dependent deacetylase [Gammaproteobacteria bacterium]